MALTYDVTGDLLSGTDAQTLRFNGTTLEADSFLTNNGSRVHIGNVDNLDPGALNIEGDLYIRGVGGGGNEARLFNNFGYLNLSYNTVTGIRISTTSNRLVLKTNVGSASAPTYSLDSVSTTDGWRVPNGTTAERPTNAAGVVRWNTTDSSLEVGDGINWLNLLNPTGTDAQTLRFNGTSLEADSFLKNDGTKLEINNPIVSGTAPLTINANGSEGLMIRRGSHATAGFQIGWNSGARLASTNNDGFYLHPNSSLGNVSNGSYWRFKIGGMSYDVQNPIYGIDVSTLTSGIRVPNGTDAQRPTHGAGVIRWNTTSGVLEVSDGTSWLTISTV